MKFFDDFTCAANKDGMAVCGDHTLCRRTQSGTFYVLCDGVGSGVYANISAITCAARLMQMASDGVPLHTVCATVAASMHRARSERIPFCAFSFAQIMADGRFLVYCYEAPEPVVILNGAAAVLTPHIYKAGPEEFGGASGKLETGDGLLLFSDGLSQTGLGGGGFGLGSAGVAKRVNDWLSEDVRLRELPKRLLGLAKDLSGGRNEDDVTAGLLRCREADRLVVLTGPPSRKSLDAQVVERFFSLPGKHVVCGSTTADVVARCTGTKVALAGGAGGDGSPPEYELPGVDMTTEGAVMLSRVNNIIDEPEENFVDDTPVERLAMLMQEADAITFINGTVVNRAHQATLFRELGVLPREAVIKTLSDKLSARGKLVEVERY